MLNHAHRDNTPQNTTSSKESAVSMEAEGEVQGERQKGRLGKVSTAYQVVALSSQEESRLTCIMPIQVPQCHQIATISLTRARSYQLKIHRIEIEALINNSKALEETRRVMLYRHLEEARSSMITYSKRAIRPTSLPTEVRRSNTKMWQW